MTPEQALAILKDATGQLMATRESHAAILNAIEVLRSVIAPKPEQNKQEP